MFIIGIKRTLKYKFLPSFDVLLYTGTELYISPWTRMMPYAVGVCCGWYLNKNRKTFSMSDVRKRRWPWKLYKFFSRFLFFIFFLHSQKMRNFMFFLSTFLLILALHATICRDISVPVASLCIMIGRPLIGFAVSWFIITNACGYNCTFFRAWMFLMN